MRRPSYRSDEVGRFAEHRDRPPAVERLRRRLNGGRERVEIGGIAPGTPLTARPAPLDAQRDIARRARQERPGFSEWALHRLVEHAAHAQAIEEHLLHWIVDDSCQRPGSPARREPGAEQREVSAPNSERRWGSPAAALPITVQEVTTSWPLPSIARAILGGEIAGTEAVAPVRRSR